MSKHTVGQGDSIASIAKESGHFWETLWNHPENAELKAKRKDPNVLFQGDGVFVPEIELREESRPTEQRHVFRMKGETVKFKLQLLRMGKPRANEDYVLDIDGQLIRGQTDGDGKLEHVVPANARNGRLILRAGKEEYPVRIGHLDPIDEISGLQQRLNNLGFNSGSEDGTLSETTRTALQAFQAKYKLEVTGEPDAATKAKLEAIHP